MSRIKKHKTKYQGTTLIEVLLYTALTATLLLVLSGAFATALRARVENTAIMEVQQQAAYISKTIEKEILDADSALAPLTGASGDSLELDIYNNPDSSTFSLSSGVVTKSENGEAAFPLSTDEVIISNLVFVNSGDGTNPEIITYSFTISHVNPDNVAEYKYSKTYQKSVTIRR